MAPRVTINEVYATYKQDPTLENYEELGRSLVQYIRAVIAKEFGNRYYALEDVVGEVAIKVLRSLAQYDENKGSLASWIYGIVVNTCLDMRRSHTSKQEERLIGNETKIEPGDRLTLQLICKKLPKVDQRLVKLKLAGFSTRAIACALQLKETTVDVRWFRVQDKLRALMGRPK
jgi:RNA polymerase sigma factor (sigma-70 family)